MRPGFVFNVLVDSENNGTNKHIDNVYKNNKNAKITARSGESRDGFEVETLKMFYDGIKNTWTFCSVIVLLNRLKNVT